jgi:two-component system sensor histidine kinase DesK
VTDGRTTLTVENNGVPDAVPSGGGSGLAGLQERLAEVDGTLAFAAGQGRFRLTAAVPLLPGSAVPAAPRCAAGRSEALL